MADDFDSDPLAYLHNQTAALSQAVNGIYQSAQAQQAQAQLVSQYQEQAAAFEQNHADFRDAYAHAVSSRQADLEAIGYSQREAANILVAEEASIVQRAMSQGKNPAEAMYNYARSRGFATAPGTAEELEADAKAFNEMAAAEAKSSDPDNMSDAQLDALWADMEKSARGQSRWR